MCMEGEDCTQNTKKRSKRTSLCSKYSRKLFECAVLNSAVLIFFPFSSIKMFYIEKRICFRGNTLKEGGGLVG